MLLGIFEWLPPSSLTQARLCSKSTFALCNLVLYKEAKKNYLQLLEDYLPFATKYISNTLEKQQDLAHYQEFLDHINLKDLHECAWYKGSPAHEIQTVLECLVLLKGLPEDISLMEWETPSMKWSILRKIVLSHEFRHWLFNIKTNVDDIPHHYIQRVEDIIRHDATITYERVRTVSQPAYKLLIVIAAALQYGNIWKDLKTEREFLMLKEDDISRSLIWFQLLGGERSSTQKLLSVYRAPYLVESEVDELRLWIEKNSQSKSNDSMEID